MHFELEIAIQSKMAQIIFLEQKKMSYNVCIENFCHDSTFVLDLAY